MNIVHKILLWTALLFATVFLIFQVIYFVDEYRFVNAKQQNFILDAATANSIKAIRGEKGK
jgi:hypothetical protein